MDSVVFIGLGKMGGPVTERIQMAGSPMVVCDLNAEAQAPFLKRGARSASTPAEVARLSDVVYTALPTQEEVEKSALGPEGILHGISKGSVYVDISTGGPELIWRTAARFPMQACTWRCRCGRFAPKACRHSWRHFWPRMRARPAP